jgi:hypothetical protein
MPNNRSVTLLASAARTADTTAEFRNHDARGIILVVDVTAKGTAPSVTPNIMTKDEADNFDNILWTASAAITATGQYRYIIYPGASGGSATQVAGIPLPLEWQLFMDHTNTDSITYSVRGHLIV